MQGVVTEDQAAVIALLTDPATHGAKSAAALKLERFDTHGAVVVLAGDRAYKLKRAVRYPFFDYSTAARRHHACVRELDLNRRTAPDIYLAVRPVLRARDGTLGLGRPGEGDAATAVDWVVEMRRFGGDALLDQRARDGRLDAGTMLELADAIAAFHRAAERRPDLGGHDGMARIVDGIVAGLEADADRTDPAKVAAFASRARALLARDAALLDRRRAAGFVRHGHGDLHLRNVCLWQGRPTLFDAIEFDDRIATCDVLYDLAFLLMDLEHRGLRALANAVFNHYMARAVADDGIDAVQGVALLPLFLACRAGIRAQVGLAGARAQPDAAKQAAAETEARAYLDLALAFLAPPAPLLVAIGGRSGTGKSTIAFALAPGLGSAPGALVLRSDVLRKAIMGTDLFERLPQEGYGPDVTERVFSGLARAAGLALAGGHAVIADAVYMLESQRAEIAAAARAAGVAFTGIWLDASRECLERRVAARTRDVSDATVAIVRLQMDQQPGRMDWVRVDAAAGPGEVADAVRRILAAKTKHLDG
ncbi:MAG: AAA family ATPase [Alphaproteobacteria bacterium]|nr:AAA family ATPase [Alphaproteobacteria bacterium]